MSEEGRRLSKFQKDVAYLSVQEALLAYMPCRKPRSAERIGNYQVIYNKKKASIKSCILKTKKYFLFDENDRLKRETKGKLKSHSLKICY